MNLTHHAELRSAQRSISEDEMLILLGIGMEIEQKGGIFTETPIVKILN
jgi:hypothetical protein